MPKKRYARNATVWALITALLNPALITAAYARDTDIFMGLASSVATAEPNILLLLDTSDSMNTYEGWREYEGDYDSHVEYLWNDPTYINTITTTAPNSDLSNVGSSPSGYFVSYSGTCPNSLAGNPACPRDSGYFAGSTDAIRAAMKTAALAYANATETGDPGARSAYRNYSDASWIYWLPTGTAETDNRLWSVTFNRFVGGIRVSNFSSTNGTTNPVVRGGFSYGNNNDRTVGTALHTASSTVNRCTASLNEMMPSTVYAPTEHPRNEGKWVNQQWMRWERWLNLENSRAAVYPGDHNTINLGGTNYRIGYSGGSGSGYDPALTPSPGPTDPVVNGPGSTPHGVSTSPPNITRFRDNTGTNGAQGQPIRVQLDMGTSGFSDNTSDSHGGWTTLKADLGGYTFQSNVNSLSQSILQSLRGVYGYTLLTVTGANATENERFSAWLGNRDVAATAFGLVTGTPAYYDIRPADIGVTSGTATTTCTRTCGSLAVGATGPTNDGADAGNTTRFYYKPNGSGQYCNPNGTLSGNCQSLGGTVPDPPLCSNAGTQNYTNRNNTGCAWSGRQSKYIEGVGTVFYGGTCSGSCRGAGFVLGGADCPSGQTSTSYCNQPSSGNDGSNWLGNFTVDGTSYSNVTKNVVGTCSDLGDTTQSCATRKGLTCVYASNSLSSFCPNQNSSVTTGGSTLNYPRYNVNATETNLVHDCKADEPANNNGANVYMTALKRNFDQSYNTSINNSNNTAAYTTNAANAASPPAIDLYSVNYLNWKFGPKGPNGQPIGRKTRLQIAKDALAALIATTDGVRFGLETFNALPNDTSLRSTQGSQGGKIVFPVKRMGSNAADTDYSNRAALVTVVNSQLAKAATPLTESLYEAYLYFSGRAPRFGTSGAITTNFGASALPAVGGGNVTDGADATAVSAGSYVSPIMNNPNTTTPSSCQKNFVILITDGGPEKDVDANDQITARQYAAPLLGTIAPDTRVDASQTDTTSGQFETGSPSLPYGPPSIADTSRPDGGYVWLDELAYFMSKADMSPGAPHTAADTSTDQLLGTQPVVTYTIGFAGANSPVLENAATRAGGAYYIAEDSAQLSAALTDALIQIKAYTPTVAAPTVPLSALNRAQNALDVYLAFFSPTPSQAWKGTVKRFRIGVGDTDCGPNKPLCLIGQTVLSSGVKDIEKVETDSLTGFSQTVVDPEAVSFWNPPTLEDGSKPDKGGTGYQLISVGSYTPATRNVYTYLSSNAASPPTSAALTDGTNLVTEANPRITKAMLGNAGMSDAARSTLINFIRGGNPADADCNDAYDASAPTACTTWRSWSHADVQHSRPTIITYDSTPTADAQAPGNDRATAQYLFFLTNDGLLHAIDGATGQEKWAFLVEEALPFVNAAMTNANGASLDLADGSPGFWLDRGDRNGIVDGSERVWLYFGLRRGGRAYYALDITNINAPKFMWRITPTERCVGASCSASSDYALLGQSWSTPVAARVAATTGASGARPNGNADPVVMFGGGYDPQQDTYPLPAGTTSDTMGKALFVAEGSTGALVKRFSGVAADFLNASSIDWSIPSDLTVLNIDQDAEGLMDRIVVGDVGGNLWRFDIGASDATSWRGKKLAALSDSGVPNRKILFPPVVVPQLAPFPIEWDAVYVGTGDREHPLVSPTSDKIFMVADFDIGLYATAGTAASFAAGDFLELAASDINGVVSSALVTKRGWYRNLDPGEKVTGSPFVFNQKLRFSSYNPSAVASECLPPGEGRLNEIGALYGNILDLNGDGTVSARDRYYAGVSRGYYSPLQTVIIGGSIYTIGFAGGNVTNTTTPPTSGCGAGSQLFSCREGSVGVARRIYWYMEPEQ
jgi:Tfp pilus tip-associated adhesin PilY1